MWAQPQGAQGKGQSLQFAPLQAGPLKTNDPTLPIAIDPSEECQNPTFTECDRQRRSRPEFKTKSETWLSLRVIEQTRRALSVHDLLPLAYGHCAEGFGMMV